MHSTFYGDPRIVARAESMNLSKLRPASGGDLDTMIFHASVRGQCVAKRVDATTRCGVHHGRRSVLTASAICAQDSRSVEDGAGVRVRLSQRGRVGGAVAAEMERDHGFLGVDDRLRRDVRERARDRSRVRGGEGRLRVLRHPGEPGGDVPPHGMPVDGAA